MEEEYFNSIREEYIASHSQITAGKMMSSEAITYGDKVFAFLSRKKKMVFKLGKAFDPTEVDDEIQVFQPFKKRGPLNGWFEVPYAKKELWRPLAARALELISKER